MAAAAAAARHGHRARRALRQARLQAHRERRLVRPGAGPLARWRQAAARRLVGSTPRRVRPFRRLVKAGLLLAALALVVLAA
ncbi:MAG: hypothetical protein ABIQ52_01195, partial [Vicinamibacterales bacterium]